LPEKHDFVFFDWQLFPKRERNWKYQETGTKTKNLEQLKRITDVETYSVYDNNVVVVVVMVCICIYLL